MLSIPAMSPSAATFDFEAQAEKLTRFPRHVTIEEQTNSPLRQSSIERAARFPSEFRTLSIHVETRTSPVDGDAVVPRKTAVKGGLCCHCPCD